MFGLLKENIINNLEQVYVENGEKDFKKQFHKFISTIKESKDLKKMYNLYETINEVVFSDETIAREFVEESVTYLKNLDKTKLSLIEGIAEIKSQLPNDSRSYYLDQLVFNESISIKDKVECKISLIRSLVKEETTAVDFSNYINSAETNLNEKLNNLTEEQQKVVQLLAENDTESIKNYYSSLINEAQSLIDDKIIESQSKSDTVVKLIEAKKKLKTLATDATPNNIELVLDLKGSL